MTPWVVHKFGGTSVANAERYRGVAKIVAADRSPKKAVVVSAMSGVTNALIELVELAKQRDDAYLTKLAALKDKHLATVAELFPHGNAALTKVFETDFTHLAEILRGIWHARSCNELTVELVSGHGEIWSAQFLCDYFVSLGKSCTWLDARKVLVIEPLPASVAIDWKVSREKTATWLATKPGDLVIVTGFVASTKDGMSTTLKRNGSDYSASIFGSLLDATSITIWTDVDGVLSADPRLVPEAVVLDGLSYHEATELAYFGAKVVHPSTMGPAVEKKIPIWIRNTFRPDHPGTCIGPRKGVEPTGHLVKGFTTVDNMALVNVEGTGMIGVPGVAQRLFGALREIGVSVTMISQASSEQSICFAIPQSQAAVAREAAEKAFYAELHHKQIQTINVTENCSVLAIVGDNMVDQPGVAGKFLAALGKARVNVRAIAQGSSERNISVVIDGTDARRALRAVHAAFYLSHQTVSIGVVGAGLIGGTFLDQLNRETERLKRDFKIDLRVRGILNSRKMATSDTALDLGKWRETVESSTTTTNLDAFVQHIHAEHVPHAVIIDATADAHLPKSYAGWLEKGIHIITPNKKGNTASLAQYRELQSTARRYHRHYLYSTTVGAGLPVINTLRDLVQTGDQVWRIEGIFSGTLSYLFNSYDGKRPFSAIVREAREQGFTEPDPRDDLSGTDVARKLVILAREMGLGLEVSDIEVESLVPEKLRAGSVDDYMGRLPEADAEMEARRRDAEAAGECLRYVGVVEPKGKAEVRLRRYPKDHPFAGLSRTDNIVLFQTARYHSQPLIVRGPGAGPEVTAAGVFADLLRLTSYLGGA